MSSRIARFMVKVVWIAPAVILAPGGCGTDRDEASRSTPSGATTPGVYEVEIASASLRQSRRADDAFSISLGGPVNRLGEDAPYAMSSSWLRIDSLHDASGARIEIDVTGAMPAASDPERAPYFEFGARPPLRLQGLGHLDPLPEAAARTASVRGMAEVIEFARIQTFTVDIGTTELPMAFAEIADGAYVALRSFEQTGSRGHINLWTFISNSGGQPRLDPRPRHLNEYLAEGNDGPSGYDPQRPPFILGYQLLDESGTVLGYHQVFGAGRILSEGWYEEADEPFQIDSAQRVGAVRFLVATEFRLLEVPFETPVRSFLD